MLHTVVLTTDGHVFQWGFLCSDEEQQVGVVPVSFLTGSRNDSEKERIIQIACGEFHALALTAKGQVYSWASWISKTDGVLGTGPHVDGKGPFKISGTNGFDSRISQIACGGCTSYALDNEGDVSGALSSCSSCYYRRLHD